ncbi:hypothetical protein GCM10027406_02910 [Leifsonia lichenia]
MSIAAMPSRIRRLVDPDESARTASRVRAAAAADYLARLRTFAAIRPTVPVFSHWSAAAVHGLPSLGPPPSTIHILGRPLVADRAWRGIVEHPARAEDATIVRRGLAATSVAATVADLAAIGSFLGGVVAADHAVAAGAFGERTPLATPETIERAAARLPDLRGRERALDVAAFADGRAESPIESVSRVVMSIVGLPPPELQHRVELPSGTVRVDFAWPEHGVLGEADGDVKLTDQRMRGARSPMQVLRDQVARERAIERVTGMRVVRWGWGTARRADRLGPLLARAGLTALPS